MDLIVSLVWLECDIVEGETLNYAVLKGNQTRLESRWNRIEANSVIACDSTVFDELRWIEVDITFQVLY